ncbi:MAG: hypothetical protein LDL33_10775 [Desulfomonile sp.]|nr:hypothetical protein [Desulfomonile sp.]
MKHSCAVVFFCSFVCIHAALLPKPISAEELPDSFVQVDKLIPGIKVELRYFTDNNFVGRRVGG